MRLPIHITSLAVLTWPIAALADSSYGNGPNFPEHDLALGPSVAYVHGPSDGVSLNFDTAYTYFLFAASVNLKLNYYPGTGAYLYGPQAELSGWFLANYGLGGGYLWGDQQGPVFHLFFGVPFGDDFLPKSFEPFNSGYCEPYLRLNFFYPHGLEFMFEGGLMFKVTTYTL
jgi:hypothetical protein